MIKASHQLLPAAILLHCCVPFSLAIEMRYWATLKELGRNRDQPVHVPKFGNWDGDNIPYTSFFENARKDKTPRTKIFNPNDPEQNPDAFVSGIFPTEYELRNNEPSVHRQDVDEFHQEYREVQANNKSYTSHQNAKIESGSDNSSTDDSLAPPPHRMQPNSRNSDEDSLRISSSQQSVRRPGRFPRNDTSQDMPSSIPKFGIWNEMDSKSGDGFTVIFNKVKQEKQAAATKLPKVPASTTIYPSTNHAKPPSKSKVICCICPPVDE